MQIACSACKESALMYATLKLDADSSNKKHTNTGTERKPVEKAMEQCSHTKPIQSAAICHNFVRLNVVGRTNRATRFTALNLSRSPSRFQNSQAKSRAEKKGNFW